MMTKRTPRVLTIVLLACLFSSAAGFAQTVSLTPLALTFAPQVVSTTSSAKPVTLKNTSGTATLTIASISSSGDYSITTSPNPCTSIAPLGTCTLNISFAPNAVGVIDGAVTIVDNASTSPQVVTLAGTAIPPISLAPTSLSFGTVAVGSSSAPKTVKVTNNTAAAVTVSSPTISGEYKFPPASGSIVQTCTGVPLPAGGSCTATIEFQPTITGKIPGALTVSHTASGTPQVVALTGTGSGTVTSAITFTPTSLNFGNVLTGTTTLVKTVTLKNVSSNAITVNSVSGSGNYNATTTCGVVQPAGTCPMNVTFSPSNLGSIGGAASVTETDNVTHAQNVPVFGMTGTGVGQLSFNPAALNFFIQDLNVPGTSQNTTLTNNTGATVNLTNKVISGLYAENDTCGASLGAHLSCAFTVNFDPNRTGGINGAVTVTDPASNSPQVLSLTATSVNPARYAFVLNNDDSLAVFSENPSTGQLRGNGHSDNSGVGFGQGEGITPSGKFFYTVSNGVGVYGFNVTAAGGITPITGSPFPANLSGCDPSNIVIDPTSKFLYFSDVCTGVWAFTIGSNGALTSVAGSPFGAGSNRVSSLSISPSGKFLYNPRSDVGIFAYTINSTTGALTQVAGSPFDSSFGAVNLIVDPKGKFAYVSSELSTDAIAAFSINSTTGALTEISGSPFNDNSPVGLFAFDPAGKFLYASTSTFPNSSSSGGVNVLSVNSSTGAVTPLVGNPFLTTIDSTAVTIDPRGSFLYVTDLVDNKAYTLSVNRSTGALALVSAIRTGQQPEFIVSSTGSAPVVYTPKFAYASNQTDKTISEYTISGSGALTTVSGSPVADANGPQAVATTPNQKFAFTANSNSSISRYSVNPTTGALTFLSKLSSTVSNNLNNPLAIAVEPTGNFLYTLNNGNNTVSAFSIASNGALTFNNSNPTGSNPQGMAMDPLGRYLYVTNTTDNTLSGYSINGNLIAPIDLGGNNATGASPMGAAIDPSGQFLYVANSGGNTVSAYSISFTGSSVGGSLTNIAGSPFNAGTTPVTVLAEPSGKFLYVLNGGSNTISAYSINNHTGVLTAITGTFTTGSSPDSLSVSNDGKFLYTANKSAGTVSIFTINADGTLTSDGSATTGTAPTSIVTTGTIQ